VTMDENRTKLSALMVNQFDRVIDVTMDLKLSWEVISQNYSVSVSALGADQTYEEETNIRDVRQKSAFGKETAQASEVFELAPRTIYAIEFQLDPVLDLVLNKEIFQAGDPFILTLNLHNHDPQRESLVMIVLEVYGAFYFWPGWTTTLNGEIRTMTLGMKSTETILEFTWPENAGSAEGLRFWGALFAVPSLEVYSLESVAFGYTV